MTSAEERREVAFDELRLILRELRDGEERIRPEARLVADLGLDSLELASAVLSLEARFAVDLVDVLDEVATVGEVVDAVTSRLNATDARQ